MGYEIYNDFTFNGKTLSTDFKGILKDNNTMNIFPNFEASTTNYNNQDGVTFLRGKVNPRVLTFNLYFDNEEFNMLAFKQWLMQKKPLPLSYVGGDKYINGVFTNITEFTTYNKRQATVQCEFTAYDPYWYYSTGSTFTQTNPVVNQLYTFENNSSIESYPRIKIEVSGTVSNVVFAINDKRFSLKKIVRDVYIDTKYHTCFTYVVDEKMTCIADYECLNGKHKYEFPLLISGSNTLRVMSGNISKITIEMNSRVL